MTNSVTNWVWLISYLNNAGIWVGASYNAVMNSIFGSCGFNGINDYTNCYPSKFILGSVAYKTTTKTIISNESYYYNKQDSSNIYFQTRYTSGDELKESAKNLVFGYNSGPLLCIYPKSTSDILNAYDSRGHKLSNSQFNNVELKNLWFCEDWDESLINEMNASKLCKLNFDGVIFMDMEVMNTMTILI